MFKMLPLCLSCASFFSNCSFSRNEAAPGDAVERCTLLEDRVYPKGLDIYLSVYLLLFLSLFFVPL